MVQVSSLQISAVLPPDQLKPSDASTVLLTVTTPDGASAMTAISGKAYRKAINQIVALGKNKALVMLEGVMRKPGDIEGASIIVTKR